MNAVTFWHFEKLSLLRSSSNSYFWTKLYTLKLFFEPNYAVLHDNINVASAKGMDLWSSSAQLYALYYTKKGNVRHIKHHKSRSCTNVFLKEQPTDSIPFYPALIPCIFQKSDWKRDSLKHKTHTKVRFDLNSRSKSTTGARIMGYAPAHSEISWLLA
jgi:hypothetical protein